VPLCRYIFLEAEHAVVIINAQTVSVSKMFLIIEKLLKIVMTIYSQGCYHQAITESNNENK